MRQRKYYKFYIAYVTRIHRIINTTGKDINWYFTATTRCISFMDFIRATQIMLFRFRFLSQRPNDVNELARAISAVFSEHLYNISCKCATRIHTRVLHSDILFYRINSDIART